MRVKVTYKPDPRKPEEPNGPTYIFSNVKEVWSYAGALEIRRAHVKSGLQKVTLLSWHEVEKVEYLDHALEQERADEGAKARKHAKRKRRRKLSLAARELKMTTAELKAWRAAQARAAEELRRTDG